MTTHARSALRTPALPSLRTLWSAGLVAVALSGAACAPKMGQPGAYAQDDEEVPAWKTPEGRRETWRELARWYTANQRPEEALEMVKRLREAGEDTMELRLIQARALTAQGIPDEAAHLLEEISKSSSKDPDVWASLGVVYVDLKREADAKAAFERALQLDDTNAATHNNLGFLLLTTDDCGGAVKHLERATTLDSTNGRYRNNLAYALVCDSAPERALKLFRSTTATEADARYDMGLAYERLEKFPSALLQYRAALTADPQHAPALEAIERLETPDPSTDVGPATDEHPGAAP